MRLYHYTCRHSLAGIRADGLLRVNRQPVLDGLELVWLTDLETPDRAALGLTSRVLQCDRTEHRVKVDAGAVHWPVFARQLPATQRRSLELAPGALPMHWYVSEQPVFVDSPRTDTEGGVDGD